MIIDYCIIDVNVLKACLQKLHNQSKILLVTRHVCKKEKIEGGIGMYETVKLIVSIAFIVLVVVAVGINIAKKNKKGDDK